MLKHIGISVAAAVCIPIACQFYKERPDAACEWLSIRAAWLVSVIGFFFTLVAPWVIHTIWYVFWATPKDRYLNEDDFNTDKPSGSQKFLNKLQSLYIYTLMLCNASIALLLCFGIPFLSQYMGNETCSLSFVFRFLFTWCKLDETLIPQFTSGVMTKSSKTIWFGSLWSLGAISQSLLLCIATIWIGMGFLSERRLLNASVEKTTCLVTNCVCIGGRVDVITFQSQDRFNKSVLEIALQGCGDHPVGSQRSCYANSELALLKKPWGSTGMCFWFTVAVICFITALVVLTRIMCTYVRESRKQKDYAILTSPTNSVAMEQYGATDFDSPSKDVVLPSFSGTIYPSLE